MPSFRHRHRILAVALPFVMYSGLSIVLFVHQVDWTQNYLGMGADPVVYVWFLHWWPFAVSHALNPFISDYVWHPGGIVVPWYDAVPSAALIAWPITWLMGPIPAYNLLSLLALPLSAWSAFLLTRYLTSDWAAAVAGGYLFGFSSYEVGHLLGHLSLDMVFGVPLALLLAVRRARGEMERSRFVTLLGLLLLVQLGLSLEVLATLCLFGPIAWAIFLIHAPVDYRAKLWRLAVDIVLAMGCMVIFAAPFLFSVVKGLPDIPPEINSPTTYSADLLNYLIPTDVTRFGRIVFAPIARRFSGNSAEQGAYLGLPLILLLSFYFRDHIADRYARALLATLILLVILSLGPWLHVGGLKINVPLPWMAALRLPLIRFALPTRFTMYVALIAAIVTSLYLATHAVGRRRLCRFVFAFVACVALAPNVRAYHWTRWPSQPFFTPQNVVRNLGHMPNVLVLPAGVSAHGLAWQMDAGMLFTLATTYIGAMPYREWSWPILYELGSGSLFPGFANDLTSFCATRGVDYILIGPGTPENEMAAVAALHWPERTEQGIKVIEVPPRGLLQYHSIEGDYTPSAEPLNWMGRQVIIHTHRERATLTLSGVGRPVPEPVVRAC